MDLPERIYFMYRDKPKAVAWFHITETIGDELMAAYGEIKSSYDIYSAEGVQLDILARIVGTDRSLVSDVVFDVTQYATAANAADAQFGDTLAQFSAGSVAEDPQLSDEYLRKLILWKIAANRSRVTIEDILEAVHIIMPDISTTIVDNENMTFDLDFSEQPSYIDWLVLSADDKSVIPTPQGVKCDRLLVAGVLVNGN